MNHELQHDSILVDTLFCVAVGIHRFSDSHICVSPHAKIGILKVTVWYVENYSEVDTVFMHTASTLPWFTEPASNSDNKQTDR